MKTLFIILIVVIGTFMTIWLMLKKDIKSSDPLQELTFQGTMGIMLGDNWEFVLSRMQHLKLISFDEANAYKQDYLISVEMGMAALPFGSTSFKASAKFSNIEETSFNITKNILTEIRIKLKPEQADMDSLMQLAKNILTRNLGKLPLTIKEKDMNFASWESPDHMYYIILDYNKCDVSLSVNPNIMLYV